MSSIPPGAGPVSSAPDPAGPAIDPRGQAPAGHAPVMVGQPRNGTVAWAMGTGVEPVEPLRVVFLCGIVASVVGLKLVGGQDPDADTTAL